MADIFYPDTGQPTSDARGQITYRDGTICDVHALLDDTEPPTWALPRDAVHLRLCLTCADGVECGLSFDGRRQ